MNGWLSVLGAGVVLLLLAPNAVSAWRGRGVTLRCESRAACALEQVGRYGCIACMAFNFKPLCGGFPSSGIFVVWAVAVPALILLYWGLWVLYVRKPAKKAAVGLAAVPAAVFLLTGLCMAYWLLAAFAVLFGAAHLYVVCNAQ